MTAPVQPPSHGTNAATLQGFRGRNTLIWTGKLFFGICMLVYFAQHVSVANLTMAVLHSRHLPVLLAVLLLIPNIALQFAKWRYLVRRYSPEETDWNILRSLLSGFAFGLITPARIGEFGGRVLSLDQTDTSLLVSLTVVDKFLSLIVTMVVGTLCAVLFLQMTTSGASSAGAAPLVLVYFAIIVILLLAAISIRFVPKPARTWVRRVMPSGAQNAIAALGSLTISDMLVVGGYSLIFYFTFITQFVLLISAFAPLDLLHAYISVCVIMLAKTIIPPVTVGELGIREGAAIYVLSQVGYAGASAFSASMLLFTINILIPSILGAAVVFRRGIVNRQ